MSTPVQVVAGVAVRDGKVLLIRSRKHGVATPGGKVAPGETHEQCLRREVMEETGLPVVRFGRFLHTDAQPTFHCHLYAMEVPSWDPVAGDDAEAAWWGEPAEILASSIPRDYPLVLDVIANGIDDAASLRAELLAVGRALGFDHIPGDVGAKVRSVVMQSTSNALAVISAEQERNEARLRAIAAEGIALARGRRLNAQRTRAEAAEAEVARLRAIVEGRTTAPSEPTCECGHPVDMHRGADRCGAHGCGCDRNAEEASWR